jgi:hypothetical protein
MFDLGREAVRLAPPPGQASGSRAINAEEVDLGIEGLVHIVRERIEGDMGDDLDDLGVAVSGVTDLSDLGWRDGTASHCRCPGEFDSAAALGSFEVPLRLAAISLPSSLANFVPVKVWAERQ